MAKISLANSANHEKGWRLIIVFSGSSDSCFLVLAWYLRTEDLCIHSHHLVCLQSPMHIMLCSGDWQPLVGLDA